MVEAISDPAQKCVMAFMDVCNLKKVRILNLMDIKDGNYKKAKNKMTSESIEKSLFSQKRAEDRKAVMSEKAVVIAAWGVDKKLSELKKQAWQCLNDENHIIIGVEPDPSKEYYDFQYIKPPTKEAQIKRISDLSERFLQYKSQG